MSKTIFIVHSYCNPYAAFLTREGAALWIYDHERRNDLVIEEVPLGPSSSGGKLAESQTE